MESLLYDMFPTVEREVVISVYRQCKQDLNASISFLQEIAAPSNNASSSSTSSPSDIASASDNASSSSTSSPSDHPTAAASEAALDWGFQETNSCGSELLEFEVERSDPLQLNNNNDKQMEEEEEEKSAGLPGNPSPSLLSNEQQQQHPDPRDAEIASLKRENATFRKMVCLLVRRLQERELKKFEDPRSTTAVPHQNDENLVTPKKRKLEETVVGGEEKKGMDSSSSSIDEMREKRLQRFVKPKPESPSAVFRRISAKRSPPSWTKSDFL